MRPTPLPRCCCAPPSCCVLQDYKDDNHKPEMALALEDFEALCGFVSPAELKQVLQQQPEVRLCVGEEAASAFINAEEGQVKQVCVLETRWVKAGWKERAKRSLCVCLYGGVLAGAGHAGCSPTLSSRSLPNNC